MRIRQIAFLLLALGAAVPAFAQAPNHFEVVQRVWDAGHRGDSHESSGCFTEAAAYALHQVDPNWGHLKKNPGQNQVRGHAVDAVLYRTTGTAIDIIGGSEEPGAFVAWQPDLVAGRGRYTPANWEAPTAGCGAGGSTPPPPPPPPPPPLDLKPVLDAIADVRRLFEEHKNLDKAVWDAVGGQTGRLIDIERQLSTIEGAADSAAKQAAQAAANTAQLLEAQPSKTGEWPEYVGSVLGRTVVLRPRR
jgi:hypothetical protein